MPHIYSTLCTFLATINGSIHIVDLIPQLPLPLWQSDHCLMEVINDLPNISRSHLLAFNRVRKYYGVYFLSEIATANGTQLDQAAWLGSRQRYSARLWPYQPKPGPKSFRVWRRLLATAFLKGHRPRVCATTVNLALRTPLGPWLHHTDSFRYQWESFYSRESNSLYNVQADGIQFARHNSQASRERPKHPVQTFQLIPASSCWTLPPDAVPVDFKIQDTRL